MLHICAGHCKMLLVSTSNDVSAVTARITSVNVNWDTNG